MNHFFKLKIFDFVWWHYYRRAETIYQVHSPFLFEFLSKIWPSVKREILAPRSKELLVREFQLSQWIIILSSRYDINRAYLHPEDASTKILLQENSPDILSPAQSLPWYHINTPSSRTQEETESQEFDILGIYTDAWDDEMLSNFTKSAKSFILIYPGIHENRNQFRSWKKLLTSAEFQFSIELYNLGLVFRHRVNFQPVHKTFIPWYWKPWKIITI